MRYLILLVIAFEVQLSFAENQTDLAQVARDIEEFMDIRTKRLKLRIESSIAEKKKNLNEALDILEQLIKQGPEKCQGYLTDVGTIRKFETNFRYSFHGCKLDSSMENDKKKFAELLKDFVRCPEVKGTNDCASILEKYDRQFGDIFAKFRNEVYIKEMGTYTCLNKLERLICYFIRDVARLYGICIGDNNFYSRDLSGKCNYNYYKFT